MAVYIMPPPLWLTTAAMRAREYGADEVIVIHPNYLTTASNYDYPRETLDSEEFLTKMSNFRTPRGYRAFRPEWWKVEEPAPTYKFPSLTRWLMRRRHTHKRRTYDEPSHNFR